MMDMVTLILGEPFTLTTLMGILFGAGLLGSAAHGVYKSWQEGGLGQEALSFEREKMKAGQEATEQTMKAKKAMTQATWDRLTRSQRESRAVETEREFAREERGSRNRQMMMTMQLIQSLMQGQGDEGVSRLATIPSIPEILRR